MRLITSGSEKSLWASLRTRLSSVPGLMMERVENGLSAGMPDVWCCGRAVGGELWVELKYATGWPVRPGTCFRLPHFTEEQRRWHQRCAAAGGRSVVLLQVHHDYFFFNGARAAQVLGHNTRRDTESAALVVVRARLPDALVLTGVLARSGSAPPGNA